MSDLNSQFENEGNSVFADAEIALPPERNVIFYNDDTTTMDFVIDVLVSIFNKPHEEAERLMYELSPRPIMFNVSLQPGTS